MSIIGIRMMAMAPAPALAPSGAEFRQGARLEGPTGAGGGLAADFLAGLEAAANDALGEEGPPLWVESELTLTLARRAEAGAPSDAPSGNPHPVGSEAWIAFGRQTGVWFEIEPRLLAWGEDAVRSLEEERAGQPFDLELSSARERWYAFVWNYAHQVARLSGLMSRAARTGASDGQLAALADAALEKGNVGAGSRGDFQRGWTQADSDLRFGNIHGGGSVTLGDSPLHVFKLGARHALHRMGDQAVEGLERQAQELGLDLFESDDRVGERVGARLALWFQRHQLELAHLRSYDPAGWARLHERRRDLVEQAGSGEAPDAPEGDPSAAMRRALEAY